MSLQVGTNIHPNRPQIQPVGAPKSMNLGFKIGLGGFLEGSWRVLGGSWGHLGPKMVPRTLNVRICKQKLRLLGAKLEPQIDQNRSRSDPKGDNFLIVFCSNLDPSWPHLDPQNPPKIEPSWSHFTVELPKQTTNTET